MIIQGGGGGGIVLTEENQKDREGGDNERVYLQESMIIQGGGGGGIVLTEENKKNARVEINDVNDSDEENNNYERLRGTT
jgi:hypothetical protein